METIKGSLGLYAYIKTYGMIFISVLMIISAIFFFIKIIKGDYVKSPSSKIDFYTIPELNDCPENDKNTPLCKLQLVYTDGDTIYKYDTDKKSKVGNTTVFYEKHNPQSYMQAESPYIFPSMISCVSIIILIFALIRLFIIKSDSGAAAVVGGLDILSSVLKTK